MTGNHVLTIYNGSGTGVTGGINDFTYFNVPDTNWHQYFRTVKFAITSFGTDADNTASTEIDIGPVQASVGQTTIPNGATTELSIFY